MTPIFMPSTYRPDIDGLRALAVLIVVGYHAFPEYFPGGFIGVDIFFVISGFLITEIINNELNLGKFSFVAFYTRRICRIFPALLFILLVCIIIGWFHLLAYEFATLGSLVFSAATFMLNYALIDSAGYFNQSSYDNPLLHLWSLSVEEQFYLIYPLILWQVSKRNLNILSVISVFLLTSFLCNLYFGITYPTFDFYSTLTRFWELLVGSLIALLAKNKLFSWLKHQINVDSYFKKIHYLLNCFPYIGIALVVYAVYRLDSKVSYPHWWAVLPTLATVFLLSGRSIIVNRYLLSNRVLIWIGLISYPLYLWHWPIFSFLHVLGSQNPPWEHKIIAIFISIFLAWITYRFIETSFRGINSSFNKAICLTLLMIAVGACGLLMLDSGGLQSREVAKLYESMSRYNYSLDNQVLTYEDLVKQKNLSSPIKGSCFLIEPNIENFKANECDRPGGAKNARRVVLLGDSHAAFLGAGLQPELMEMGYKFYQFEVVASSCRALFIGDDNPKCNQVDVFINDSLTKIRPDYLIVFADYAASSRNALVGDYIKKIEHYKSLGVKKIIFIGQMPKWEDKLPSIVIRKYLMKHLQVPKYSGYVAKHSLILDQEFNRESFPDGVVYFSLRNKLCNEFECMVSVGNNIEHDLLVFDDAHLTLSGAKFISKDIIKIINDANLH